MTDADVNTNERERREPTLASLLSVALIAAPVVGAWLGLGWRWFRLMAGWG